MSGTDDALYERLAAFVGRSAATAGTGKDPVNAAMIRHWCEAMGDAHPAYRGPDAVAPPTMLQAWTMGGLSGHTDRSSAHEELFGLLDGAGYTSVVATDCEQEYLRPLRPGQEIGFDTVIESVSERKTTKLGTGHFVTTRTDVRADGVLAGTHRFRILKYAPAARPPRKPERLSERAEQTREPVREQPTREPVREPVRERPTREPVREDPKPAPRRPRPVVNRDNAGFWEGVAAHRLLIQRCGDCATPRFPWLPGCADCGSREWEAVEASGAGTVFSYVVMHHPSFPAFDPPYAVGLIELAEGVRMVSNVVGVPYDKVRIGMPVRLEFLRVDEELELPVFRAGGED
ncbi:bifunctional MaoC family dehydratase N-terminal/OB-fold nucleic acid binding domain-containing protein [Streptomyces sp. SP18ES09]|uniref:bifunctional MaoC family dehydratase N-terminal/OB-fold nucleic acid binding domain-containing protein n=1 Tax=Streptomyces sp. SP18ES09 TaxID=3002532 RepID=UPI002E7779F0|nr:bifunctional MaoC family dehydratase N-terminal/OB-fold nucleic acid binding domain-containing protein [Streptomyces sp. SP18ES09]MEE1818801.1 bifunctional MaoC family dehydratase N-terminal/OB-fold nucleic acid binding domain-containing protein [Streptomyces sp. SP18ES09]